jgi:hypothetical protein
MTYRVALAAVTLALAACAGVQRASQAEIADDAPAPARDQFLPADGDAIFATAVRLADLDGYPVKTCDAARGHLETRPLELEAGCGATACLARQALEVKLGYHAARVTVTREVYDGAARAWRLDAEASAEAARALLARLMAAPRLAADRNPCAYAVRSELTALSAALEPASAVR